MTSLPEPSFISRDPEIITQQLITMFEAVTGRTLYPAQVERILIDLIAYRETLIRIGIQEAAKQNMVNYAVYPMIDHLGSLLGVTRLEAQPAVCTLRFTLEEIKAFDVIIPAGIQAETKDGSYIFEIDEELVISAGETTGDVTATSTETGTGANGYLAGEVNSLVEPVFYVDTVENTDTTSGGAAKETDDRLRERIKLAPETFSNAGSRGAYEYHAKSAHQNIIDVAVESLTPGEVDVYILTSDGAPSSEMISLVEDALNKEYIRPLTDTVNVNAPGQVDFSIEADITLYTYADETTVKAAINTALDEYIAEIKLKLGKDIVPSQIISLINSIEGVYRVELTSPSFDELGGSEWANCTGYTLNYQEAANG